MKLVFRSTAVAVGLLAFANGAFAQATRTWVSGVGDDLNPCSRTAPCKTFAGAISKTATGGEINAMDDGGFGAVTITKPITIDGGGHLAGIAASGVNGIVINMSAPTANDVVTIRGLQINGFGTGLDGIKVLQADHVNIEDSRISGFSSAGVSVEVAGVKVQITNTSIRNNGTGIYMNNGDATIRSCTVTGNTGFGLDATGASAIALVAESNVSFNGTGIQTAAGALVRITHNDIFDNVTNAWNIVPASQIQTYRDNRVRGTGVGALTDVP